MTDVELAQFEVLCQECKTQWDEDYGDILDQLPRAKPQINTFKYQLTQKLEVILEMKSQKTSQSNSKKKIIKQKVKKLKLAKNVKMNSQQEDTQEDKQLQLEKEEVSTEPLNDSSKKISSFN